MNKYTRKRVYELDKAILEYNALIETTIKEIRTAGGKVIAYLAVVKGQLRKRR